jgi:hypothetical protein
MELYLVNESQQPFSTRELMKKFEKIALFSARSQL